MVDVEVAIVGAGPVGLTAALGLARRGISVGLYEREKELGKFWRASTFHPPSLDVAADLGIVDEMLTAGLVASMYQMRDYRSGPVARFDLDAIASETAWPFRLQLEQYKYSAIAANALKVHPNANLHYRQHVVGLTNTADHAEIELADGMTVSANWVIAADGSGSAVRQLAGIDYEGETYPSRRLLLSIQEPLDELVPDLDLVNYVYGPIGAGMVLRIPDLWRVMFTVPNEVDDARAREETYYGARLHELLGVQPPVVATQVYYIQQKIASSLRRDRVLLIGDAAHTNSPTGGMGLNSGIHDAFDLITTLTANGDTDRALDAWSERRRRAVIEEVHRVSRRSTADLGEPDDLTRARKQDEVRAIAADPDRAKEWLMDSSMINSVRKHPIGVRRTAPYTGTWTDARVTGATR